MQYIVIIESVRKTDRPDYYEVDVALTTGERETFLFEVSEHQIVDRSRPELDYGLFTDKFAGARGLATLLCSLRRGEQVTFPVDFTGAQRSHVAGRRGDRGLVRRRVHERRSPERRLQAAAHRAQRS